MSFNQQSWGRISGSANNDVITLQNGSYSGAPNVFTYISATDTVAEISAANYFLPVFIELNPQDLIYIAGTDGVAIVTTVTVSNVSVTVVTTIPAVTNNGAAVEGNVVVYDDNTGDVIRDSGISSNALVIGVADGFNVIAGVTTAYAGGGTSNAFTVAGITTDYDVVATLASATNAVAVSTAEATDDDEITVTFTADPGADTTVTYWAFAVR